MLTFYISFILDQSKEKERTLFLWELVSYACNNKVSWMAYNYVIPSPSSSGDQQSDIQAGQGG